MLLNTLKRSCCLLLVFAGCGPALSADLRVAVASNFYAPMQVLSSVFEQRSGQRILLSPGSSGKHYAQILNGAPFDVFFSADADKPERLEKAARIVPGSRFTYAIGRLLLLSNQPIELSQGLQSLTATAGFIAIANPKLAPYGLAAQQALEAAGVWERIRPRLVTGENVGQALQFVISGNAQYGFVAKSYQQALQNKQVYMWDVPAGLYAPVVQQAVVLRDSALANEFIQFVVSADGKEIIARFGYDVP